MSSQFILLDKIVDIYDMISKDKPDMESFNKKEGF